MQGDDWVTIKIDEGVMKRTDIVKSIETGSVIIEFDDEYKAGKMIGVNVHHLDEFTTIRTGIKHRVEISDVKAPEIASSDIG